MKNLNKNEIRNINGGAVYSCPWNDYRSTSFWTTYGHAIAHAYRRGLFNLPLAMIRVGLGF